MEESRLQILLEAVASDPDSVFIRYGLALELAKSDPEGAWEHFDYLLTHHPEYSATYHQAALFLMSQERKEEAREVITRGVEVTQKQGNLHAQSKLEELLGELEGQP